MESNNPSTSGLPRLCAPPDPPLQFLYKESPDDFVVEELPLYEPSGEGSHTWLWIEKRGLTTHSVARILAQKLGKNPADAGIAGLKDAQAVTRQWITFENIQEPQPQGRDAWLTSLSDEKLRVLSVSRHRNKLRMGHLRGNRFIIRLHPINGTTTEQLLLRSDLVLKDSLRGIPNYFGEQRFGNAGNNAAFGKMLVRGETKAFNDAMIAAGQARAAYDRKMRNLLVNAYQSELFNRVLSQRIATLGTLRGGDLTWLHRNGAVFKIASDEEAQKEQPRADAHEISPSGPVFGPKMAQAEGAAGEIEAKILAEENVTLQDFGRKEAERQPGARRPLRVFFLEAPSANLDGTTVLLKLALPSGSYATVVLDEIRG